MQSRFPHERQPKRGAVANPANRFDGIGYLLDPETTDPMVLEEVELPATRFLRDDSQSILSRNDSPDVGFAVSVNPYRGCEHGCAYCYARPTHEYLGLSSGLDFESVIMVKERAPELLRQALASPAWVPQTIAFSGVTDCYQPVERRMELTRRCLQVCAEFRNPVGIVTKNRLVTRDIDVLGELADSGAAMVHISITTLDTELAHRLEPRAATPPHRLAAIRQLAAAGIPVGVLVAPVIPGLTDEGVPGILDAAAEAGATYAGWIMLRLPHQVKDIFSDWLERHVPDRRQRVLDRIRLTRDGDLDCSRFGMRMRGSGPFAEMVGQLFRAAARKAGLGTSPTLNTDAFRNPDDRQLRLF